jgi:HJR/Mrr/RecB family endonuclease
VYIKKPPEKIDMEYFKKEADEYQKYDNYFIHENELFLFNNSMYNYTDREIDNILGRLEFANLDRLKNGVKLSHEQLISKYITETEYEESKLLKKSKNASKMTGKEFEQLCKEMLLNYGWLVNTTKASGDHGIDIIARRNGKDVGFQCKKYVNKLAGNKAIQEVYTGCHFYDLDIPVIVTSIGFTKQAIQEAKKLNIELLNIDTFFDFAKGK